MRTAIVKGPGSKLHGVKTRCCRQPTKTGESVLWDPIDTRGYQERRFVLHAVCALALAEAAPEGVTPRSKSAAAAEFAAIRRRQLSLVAS